MATIVNVNTAWTQVSSVACNFQLVSGDYCLASFAQQAPAAEDTGFVIKQGDILTFTPSNNSKLFMKAHYGQAPFARVVVEAV